MKEEDVMLTPENIQMWMNLIGNSGFPMAITIYLFMRFEKKMENLEAVIIRSLNKHEE
ncbi:hypothetical protein Bsph_0513 [Lysinibacillus sphaericus C3-41]|uniref:YvrJ family protein n=1 Tax=Lysinibacillus sphaericus (strain C3-41) TaxID=444177 RepID=B1HWI1_LYSSC|nr:hypothetical protein Bsph_0513 [Lysinibacillus sphaericus C3-41]